MLDVIGRLMAENLLIIGCTESVGCSLSCHLLRCIPVDNPPPLVLEPLGVPGDTRKLPGDAPVVRSRPRIDAASQLSRIEHGLAER